MGRVCTVGFSTSRGDKYVYNTEGHSLFETCARALLWFDDWSGPRPGDATVLDVSFTGNDEQYFVRAGRVRRWMEETEFDPWA